MLLHTVTLNFVSIKKQVKHIYLHCLYANIKHATIILDRNKNGDCYMTHDAIT